MRNQNLKIDRLPPMRYFSLEHPISGEYVWIVWSDGVETFEMWNEGVYTWENVLIYPVMWKYRHNRNRSE